MSTIKLGISKYRNNDGISCYVNSILHIMQQLPLFSDYLISGKFLNIIKNKINNNINIKTFVIYELYRLFKLSYENDNINITPDTFKKLIGTKNEIWAELEQQDSQEFYIFLISQLEEDLGIDVEFIPNINFSKIESDKLESDKLESDKLESEIYKLLFLRKYYDNVKNNFSIIKELFIGSTSSNIICEFCKSCSPNFEDFITLSIDLPNTTKNLSLNECLEYTLKDEQLDKNNKIYCEFCGLKNKSTKQIKLFKTPTILAIHLKRFKVNNYGIQTAKITNNITYPIENFNIEKFFDKDSPYKETSKYNLVGVNIHEELAYKSVDVGHYTSIVKNRYDNKWYLFNDSNEPKKLDIKKVQNKNAYMLFYFKQ
jgi:ubiquitin C-terminal hydrolase